MDLVPKEFSSSLCSIGTGSIRTIFGGFTRADILSCPPAPGLITGPNGRALLLIQAKQQQESGTTDEKIPFAWHTFLESDIPNGILILDGAWWQTPRGRTAFKWAASQSHEGKTWRVLTYEGFLQLMRTLYLEIKELPVN